MYGHVQPGPPRRRQLLRLSRSRPRAARADDRRRFRKRDRRGTLDGQSASARAQPVRNVLEPPVHAVRFGSTGALLAIREWALLREHERRRLRYSLLWRIRRQRTTVAVRELRPPLRPPPPER